MTTSTQEAGTVADTSDGRTATLRETQNGTSPKAVIGRLVDASSNGGHPHRERAPKKQTIAVFCNEPPESYIGGHVARVVPALAARGHDVTLFCRKPFVLPDDRVSVRAVGGSEEDDTVEQAQDFTKRAGNAFLQAFPTAGANSAVGVIAYEWSAAPVLSLLQGLRNQSGVLSLHTLERQRSAGTSELAQKIVSIEREGLQTARSLLLHDPATLEAARQYNPACVSRATLATGLFPTANFETIQDPGEVKARYQVGPIDPVLLFIGDLNEQYNPEALPKAMPALLRHHPQARLIIVGDGPLLWPLKVYARYLLLEHAIRVVGDVQGQALAELVQAADIVVVPSKEATPWWPIQAAWAARKPVVVTHYAAPGLLEHEKDSVLIYPSENSVVWGVERVLYDAELRKSIGEAGRKKLDERFGWPTMAEQVEQLLFAEAAVAAMA